MEIVLADQNTCTGCGACFNSCHKNAIKMIPDTEGFIQPKIDKELCVGCGMCEKACPVLHPKYENKSVDTCYAMWADDERRQITSTAGFFLLLAEKIIEQKGVVYGAAWTKEWDVHHIGVEQKEDLFQLCGSKYLQSNTEDSYQQAEINLRAGRKVLFSGCPCQIAGLYGFLGGRSYDNLSTVEVLCHGIPSPKAFHKYLADTFPEKKITKIDFRDKSFFDWSSNANIYMEGEKTYRKNANEDPFYRGFLPCMILRRSCATCPFSRIPRQADITIGDFWGIKAADKTWHDKKGTELVLVNSKKGEEMFCDIEAQFQRIQKFPLEAATRINKTILHPFHSHPGRKHFFSAMELKPFNQLVEDSLEHKYDIGVVGFWYGINYGSVLTYYALYELLRDIGYDPVMIPKPPQLWNEKFDSPNTIAQRFIWSRCNVFNRMISSGEINRMNDRCKDFILGSDVVWSYRIAGKDTDQFFFLDWVESGHKKIAFASSFGNTLYGPDSYVKKAIANLQQFDAISIRESSGVQKAKELTGRKDIEQVLDPVFLCNRKVFDSASENAVVPTQDHFVFAYLLKKNSSEKKKEILEALKDHFHAESRVCGNPNSINISRETYGEAILPEISVEEWIWHIRNCSMYVGDSYHGLCFAILYHRPFLIVYGTKTSQTTHQRFESLLATCGLEDRILYSKDMTVENAVAIAQKEIDWDSVEEKLNGLREKSIEWLKNVLKQPVKETTAEQYLEDARKRLIAEQQVQIDNLRQELQKYKEKTERQIATKIERSLQINGTMGTAKKAVKYVMKKIRAK